MRASVFAAGVSGIAVRLVVDVGSPGRTSHGASAMLQVCDPILAERRSEERRVGKECAYEAGAGGVEEEAVLCRGSSEDHENRHRMSGRFVSAEYFFFQAEDGIRDRNVTGVQTCALPIS